MRSRELKFRLRTLIFGKFELKSAGSVSRLHEAKSSNCKLNSGADGDRHLGDSLFDDK